jgi:NAD+ synthase
LPICEDIWGDLGVCETLAESGAEILLYPNGSPYYRDKVDVRHQVAIKQVIETGLPLLYANQLGGQDELVFDGAIFCHQCRQVARLPDEPVRGRGRCHHLEAWRAANPEGWTCVDGPMSAAGEGRGGLPRLHARLRDYVNKNGFKNVVLGLSGGIDSAICAALRSMRWAKSACAAS